MEHELNLHHLELFHTVVREGSVSAAAARLRTSQPSVSRQIRDLEENMGLALLERLPRGMRPTEAGTILFEHATNIFAVRDQARQALRDRLDLVSGRLSVGASQTVGTYLLPTLLSDFQARHEGPELRFEMGNTSKVEERLREGWIEIGLVEGGASREFERGQFGSDELVAVASPDFLKRWKFSRNLAGICQLPLILRENGAGSRILLERTFLERGVRPNILATLDTAEAILRFVQAGLGITLLPRLAVAESLSRGKLQEIPLKDVRLELKFEWILVSGRPLSPTAARFLEELGTKKSPTLRRSRSLR